MNLESARHCFGGLAPRNGRKSRGQFPFQNSDVAKRPVVRSAWALARHVGSSDDVDLVSQMIERQQSIEKHEFGVGQVQIILRVLAYFFQLPNHVVSKISNGSRREWRQSLYARGTMFAQQALHHLKNIFLHNLAPASALNLDRPLASLHSHVRSRTQECVTADLLAALYRLQQECMRLLLSDGKKCGNWREQIGANGLHYRDERSVAGQAAELFEIRLQHRL